MKLLRPQNLKHLLQKSLRSAPQGNAPEIHSFHRKSYTIYDLQPTYGIYTYVAPSATLCGDVHLSTNCQVWDNVVIRGDINVVRVAVHVSIGENSVLRTVAALPTGIPAILNIGTETIIQPGCTLVSCDIGARCFIGHKSIILEGARLSDECMIGPNSVVPPGRLIPSRQLWAGNPVRYIRNLTGAELQNVRGENQFKYEQADEMMDEYSPFKTGYLFKENSADDLDCNRKGIYREQSSNTNEHMDRQMPWDHV